MSKYKIGIVGYGKIARDQHAPAIAATEDFELIAVSNVATGAGPPGAAVFGSAAEMLRAVPELDAVSLCTPPAPRRQLAIQCLEAGKNVLLEKPPAATVAEVSDVAARAKVAGRIVFGTYHAQHNEAVKKAADMLVGTTVTSLLVTWKEDVRQWHPHQDWILAEGGFGIFDPGINAFSILTRILPSAPFIHAADLSFPSNRQAPIAAGLQFAIGDVAGEALKAELDWRWNGPPTWEITIETSTTPRLRLTDGGAQLRVGDQAPFHGPAQEYPDIYREFAQLLSEGRSKADIAPFQLVADAFMLGRRTIVEPFEF